MFAHELLISYHLACITTHTCSIKLYSEHHKFEVQKVRYSSLRLRGQFILQVLFADFSVWMLYSEARFEGFS